MTGNSGEVLALHDCVPFGEEVPAGQFGRAPEAGYGAVEVAPQHFTGKERDTESGLDYFGARYYSAAMGRFTSPDPIHIMKQKLGDPQQWNMYGYVRNNPLRLLDPAGKYVCQASGEQCDEIERRRQEALRSKNKQVKAAAAAYGDPGVDNLVTVKVGAEEGRQYTAFAKDKKRVVVQFDRQDIEASIAVGNTPTNSFSVANRVRVASAVPHEGSHVSDYLAAIAANFGAGTDITMRQSEHNALSVTGPILKKYRVELGTGHDLSTTEGRNGYMDNALDYKYRNLNAPISKSEPAPDDPIPQTGTVR